jgi:hypothetical protein
MDEQSSNHPDEQQEPEWAGKFGSLTTDPNGVTWTNPLLGKIGNGETVSFDEVLASLPPQYYHRDGTPYLDNPKPAFMQWAEDFERGDRQVAQTKTLYGERLSTVFLGLNHQWGIGPPLIFETMLFAPRNAELRRAKRRSMRRALKTGDFANWSSSVEEKAEDERIERNYPHDQLQLRYSTERQAADRHETLMLQCLIPPRWRRFLLYTIGEDETWA